MLKKKAKARSAGKKSGKKRNRAKSKKVEKSPAEVHKNLAQLVIEHADELTEAVIEEGQKGQLPTLKYLLEMASIYPEKKNDEGEATPEEDSLARTLLGRFHIPETPVVADQGDEFEVNPVHTAVEKKETAESGGPDSIAEKEEVLV